MSNKTLIFPIVWVCLFLATISCNLDNRDFAYQNSNYKLYATDTLESETSLSSYKENQADDSPKELGKYTDGVRVGNWAYFADSNSVVVSWARYKNDQLGYKTNLLSKADTIIHGPDYTQLKFTTELGAIFVSIVIKKETDFESPASYFEKLENVISVEGARLLTKESKILHDGVNKVHIVKKEISDSEDSLTLLQNLLVQIPGVAQVEVAVLSRLHSKRDASILFDGILTNFFLDGRRLYNPFKGVFTEH